MKNKPIGMEQVLAVIDPQIEAIVPYSTLPPPTFSLYELIAVLLSFNIEELSCLEHLLLMKDKEFERENDDEGEV